MYIIIFATKGGSVRKDRTKALDKHYHAAILFVVHLRDINFISGGAKMRRKTILVLAAVWEISAQLIVNGKLLSNFIES